MRSLKITLTAVMATTALMWGIAAANQANAAVISENIFVVDESGSISTEHAWLSTMVSLSDADLVTAGVVTPVPVIVSSAM